MNSEGLHVGISKRNQQTFHCTVIHFKRVATDVLSVLDPQFLEDGGVLL